MAFFHSLVARNLLIFGLILIPSTRALALECPLEMGDDYIDKVVQEVESKATCYEASQVAQSCSLGSSADVSIAGSARGVCESKFLLNLKSEDLENYKALMGRCSDKYKDESGTMYISAQAFCELKLAEAFEELYTPVDL